MQNREKSLIFVVDDEEVIASTIAAILRMKGLNAVAFTSAPEALARSRTVAPDLLITDIMMPVLSGAELAQHIQWRYPNAGCCYLPGNGIGRMRRLPHSKMGWSIS